VQFVQRLQSIEGEQETGFRGIRAEMEQFHAHGRTLKANNEQLSTLQKHGSRVDAQLDSLSAEVRELRSHAKLLGDLPKSETITDLIKKVELFTKAVTADVDEVQRDQLAIAKRAEGLVAICDKLQKDSVTQAQFESAWNTEKRALDVIAGEVRRQLEAVTKRGEIETLKIQKYKIDIEESLQEWSRKLALPPNFSETVCARVTAELETRLSRGLHAQQLEQSAKFQQICNVAIQEAVMPLTTDIHHQIAQLHDLLQARVNVLLPHACIHCSQWLPAQAAGGHLRRLESSQRDLESRVGSSSDVFHSQSWLEMRSTVTTVGAMAGKVDAWESAMAGKVDAWESKLKSRFGTVLEKFGDLVAAVDGRTEERAEVLAAGVKRQLRHLREANQDGEPHQLWTMALHQQQLLDTITQNQQWVQTLQLDVQKLTEQGEKEAIDWRRQASELASYLANVVFRLWLSIALAAAGARASREHCRLGRAAQSGPSTVKHQLAEFDRRFAWTWAQIKRVAVTRQLPGPATMC
jgi:hypothetical protein